MSTHTPVLLAEVIAAIALQSGDRVLDATFGGGGYTRAALEACAACQVIGLDRDPEAVTRAEGLVRLAGGRLRMVQAQFGDLDQLGLGPLDAAMFDFGVSSFQLDTPERGFSFRFDGPLDMRMGDQGPTAADIVAAFSEAALSEALWVYGEETNARRIARAIVTARRDGAIVGTSQLASLVETAVGGRQGARLHPATRTFQALRIVVNDELGEIVRGLEAAERALRPGGRLAIVTFHSLEDRLAKTFLKTRATPPAQGSRYRPAIEPGPAPSFHLLSRKPVEPTASEIAANPRARSARLRAAVRTEAPVVNAPLSGAVAPVAAVEWERLRR